jgi:AhpD family alkylhydroperoxidase
MKTGILFILLVLISLSHDAFAQESVEGIRPTPRTRPELKKLLEDVKVRTPRIPLPDLTDADREKLGDQSDSYETRLKYHYLNGIEISRPLGASQSSNASNSSTTRPISREQDPLFTLDNTLKVELFWIVSRVNNCQYCIGHQESKLLGLGLNEDRIAALDGDWLEFDEASQVAFRFGRKFTLAPESFVDDDITELKKYYDDNQILEMILSMAGNNAINRWKDAIGVPQRKDEGGYSRMASNSNPNQDADPNLPKGSYLTPTSPAFEKKVSQIVVMSDGASTAGTCPTVSQRPSLESREMVEKMLQNCKTRTARIPSKLPNWVRLLARFPKAGSNRVDSILASEQKGDISPLLKAQLSWILARQDRAWYALGHAREQLYGLGQTDEQIFDLDGDWVPFSEKERALFRLAKNLGNSPVVLSGHEVKKAVEVAGPRDTVQVISFTTARSSFNRITEAAGLPLD